MKPEHVEDLVQRLENHVKSRGSAVLKNGAWMMMLEAAAALRALNTSCPNGEPGEDERAHCAFRLASLAMKHCEEAQAALKRHTEPLTSEEREEITLRAFKRHHDHKHRSGACHQSISEWDIIETWMIDETHAFIRDRAKAEVSTKHIAETRSKP